MDPRKQRQGLPSPSPDRSRGFAFEPGSAQRKLTDREERIVGLLCDGMSDEEILVRVKDSSAIDDSE